MAAWLDLYLYIETLRVLFRGRHHAVPRTPPSATVRAVSRGGAHDRGTVQNIATPTTTSQRARTVQRALAVAAVVCFALLQFSDNKADVDLWGNAGFVRALPGSADFHRTNTFSFTEPGFTWINHEWGAQYLYHAALRAGGTTGMLALKLALGTVMLFVMNVCLRRDGVRGPARVLVLVLILSTMGYGFSTRPHHFTFALFAGALYVLRFTAPSPRRFCIGAVVAGMLWANLHGAYFIGLLLLLAWAAARAVEERVPALGQSGALASRTLFLAAGCFFVGTLANPYGLRLWDFVYESAGHVRPYLSEWAPFDPRLHALDHVDFMALVLLCAGCGIAARARGGIAGAVVLVLVLIGALTLRRNIPLFALTAGCVAGPWLARVCVQPVCDFVARLPRAVPIAVCAVLAALSLVYAARVNKHAPLHIEIPTDRFPVAVIDFMRANEIRGEALVFFDWAEYAIWHLYPRCRVFLDGRFRSAYSPQTIEDYFAFLYGAPQGERALTHYATDIVLVHRGNPAYARMQARAGWDEVFGDEIAALFLKRGRHEYVNRSNMVIPEPRHAPLFP